MLRKTAVHHNSFDVAPLRHPNPCDVFRGLQDDAGLSNAELARRCAVSANTVSNWRRGKVKPPGAAIAYLRLYVELGRLLK